MVASILSIEFMMSIYNHCSRCIDSSTSIFSAVSRVPERKESITPAMMVAPMAVLNPYTVPLSIMNLKEICLSVSSFNFSRFLFSSSISIYLYYFILLMTFYS